MATTVTFNGTSYSIPANREPRGWGTSLSAFLVDVAGASLSKAGGTFTLTADVNFGATYGLKAAYYKSLGTVAAAGQVRLANAESVSWRNAANGADLALKANASDYLEYSGNRVVTVGDTGTVTSTMILDGTIVNADISASAAIVDTKLDTISTALKVSNSATTATDANTASAIVARDVSGNFTAGTITANLTGNASGTSGSTTGNAATATALATARAINGTNFDGTAAITVTAAAGTLTGTTLNATVVTSSLTTVGALNSGSITSGFGAIDIGADALTAGAGSFTTLASSGVATLGVGAGAALSSLVHISNSKSLKIQRASADTGTSPTTVANGYMLRLGNYDYGVGGLHLIGMGYLAGTATYHPAHIGFIETSTGSYSKGDLIFAARDVTTDTEPTIIMRGTSAGAWTFGPTSGSALTHHFKSGASLDISLTSGASTVNLNAYPTSGSAFQILNRTVGSSTVFYSSNASGADTTAGSYTGAGAWTLGPASSSATNLVVNGALSTTHGVVGITSGSAPAAANMGGVTAGTALNPTLTLTGTTYNTASIVLNKGTYLVFVRARIDPTSCTTFTKSNVGIDTTSATLTHPYFVSDVTVGTADSRYQQFTRLLTIASDTTTVYGVVNTAFTGTSPTSPSAQTEMYAVRVG